MSKSVLLIVFLIASNVSAQDLKRASEVNVIPPSPNVAAINKYVDMPVSLYTGTPQITVPIFEIKMNQITVPISLNYHASGLKVEEIASWTGAGWTLNAGGVISRVAKGLPDEVSFNNKKGFFYSKYLHQSNGNPNISRIQVCNPNGNPLTYDKPYTTADSVAQGFIDLDPDLFHYTFPEGGGKFVFDIFRAPLQLTTDNAKIIKHPFSGELPDYFNNPDYKWILEDAGGVRYVFSQAERTSITSMCGDLLSAYNPSFNRYQSSWYLDSIKIKNEWVKFHYEPETITYIIRISESYQYRVYGTNQTFVPGQGPVLIPSFTISSCNEQTETNGKRLSMIETSNGLKVYFEANTFRSDLNGSKQLDAIRIEKDGVIATRYKLSYSYFGTDKKLKLLSVQQASAVNPAILLNGYQFEYFESSSFPSITSKNQDYWGYFNNANNISLIPAFKNDYFNVSFGSANRNPDLEHAKIGALKKLIYPTKGYTEFDYELHEYNDPNFRNAVTEELTAQLGSLGSPVIKSKNFTVLQNCSADLHAENIQNSGYLRKLINGSWVPITLENILAPSNEENSFPGNRKVLSAGNYQIYLENSNGTPSTVKIEYDKFESLNIKAGGLRIRTIAHFDPELNKKLIKAYQYTIGNTTQSSGILFTSQIFGGYITTYYPGYITGAASCMDNQGVLTPPAQYINLNDQTLIPLSTYHGSHIGYKEVKEFSIDPLDELADITTDAVKKNGYTLYTYINDKDNSTAQYPYVPQQDLSHKNGKPLSIVTYKHTSNGFKKIKEISHQYSSKTLSGFVFAINFKKVIDKYCFRCSANMFKWNAYQYQPKWHYLVKTTEKTFSEDNDTNSTPTETRLYYDTIAPIGHFFTIKKETKYRDNDLRSEEYSRIPTTPALINAATIKRNNTSIGGQSLLYNGKIVSQYSELNTATNTYYTKVSNQVDVNGNILMTTSYPQGENLEGSRKSFIWGYNKAYPIAEVINAKPDQIFYTSFEENGTEEDLLNPARTGKRYKNSGQYNFLSEANFNPPNPSQLKMSYWYWSNNQWNFSGEIAFTNSINQGSRLDEIRVYPPGASMTTYVYKPGIGVSHIVDANQQQSKYEYDDFGRLTVIRDNNNHILKAFDYNYKQ